MLARVTAENKRYLHPMLHNTPEKDRGNEEHLNYWDFSACLGDASRTEHTKPRVWKLDSLFPCSRKCGERGRNV